MNYDRKHRVTIENCPDDDDEIHQQQNQHTYSATSITDDDLIHSGNSNQDSYQTGEDMSMNVDPLTRGSKRQAWEEVDALEEQARYEKMQSQDSDKAKATETARMVEKALH